MEGRDTLSANPEQAHIHNSTCPSEWTHFTEQVTHSQIDYIISSSNITHLLIDATYKEELISDHKGLSVRAPSLFPERHTPSAKKMIPDWTTFDSWNYKFITEAELDAAVINGLWHEQSLEDKINIFTSTQQFAFKHTILHKETQNPGGWWI